MREIKRKIREYKSIAVLFLMVVALATDVQGQGGLLVSPRRVIFEGLRRTQELNLANAGSDTAEYEVSLVEMRMKEDGSFEEITKSDSDEHFASSYIKIFPRFVSLGPSESQTIKVQLINTKPLPPGEYRSYIYFKSEPKGKITPPLKKMVTNLSVKMLPIVGIAIPVIVRVGENNTKLGISDLVFQNIKGELPRLSGKFNRTGTMSIYGDVTVAYIPDEGKKVIVGIIKGMAIYTPNKARSFKIDLKDIDYQKGKLHIEYAKREEEKVTKILEADLDIQ
jgi:hypothetical protein